MPLQDALRGSTPGLGAHDPHDLRGATVGLLPLQRHRDLQHLGRGARRHPRRDRHQRLETAPAPPPDPPIDRLPGHPRRLTERARITEQHRDVDRGVRHQRQSEPDHRVREQVQREGQMRRYRVAEHPRHGPSPAGSWCPGRLPGRAGVPPHEPAKRRRPLPNGHSAGGCRWSRTIPARPPAVSSSTGCGPVARMSRRRTG